MNVKRMGIITNDESDLLGIFLKSPIDTVVMKPEEIFDHDLDSLFSIAILGGTAEMPLLFNPRERAVIEKQLKSGKKIFSEYCTSIGNIYSAPPVTTRFDRLISCTESGSIQGLQQGDILEEQCNTRIKPYSNTISSIRPILQYAKVNAHSSYEVDENILVDITDRALWIDDPETLLVCNFRLANFVKSRFSPMTKWKGVIAFIVNWLIDEKIGLDDLEDAYGFKPYDPGDSFSEQLSKCIDRSIDWYRHADMLVNGGKDGVKEGLGTEIYPDGTQRVIPSIRADCTGETSLAFYMNYLRTKEPEDKEISERLIEVCFDFMQNKDEGPLKGMLRWTQEAWGVCYQDDVARVLIPQLLKCLYTDSKPYLNECIEALHFLVNTTGTNGIRVPRTDNIDLNEEKLRELASTPTSHISAHYNAFYLGSLLLAYKLTGIETFKKVGIQGLETIMSVYPHTQREYSQTQEICRLILPLSWLYWVTGDPEHKQWLYLVTEDLLKFKHISGGYLEWDDGYRSARNDAKEGEESTLLSQNGDPVVDLLYSLNWLPIGFTQAYFVTKDPYFKDLWEGIAKFFISTQIQSKDRMIHGAWARAYDVEKNEIFGLNADVGWGPWAIETGWTVAEISAGLSMGLLEDELIAFY
ncbi:hypothetical protein [Paenibacillus nasutitermitis]|uniref:Uncharacterized protein n=1 Tax=Paenibacillus nasutitermitis TaxID=1652958 RepID=A0A916YQD7_9BACL|nr:hypothetical protein [Paenibacillus nasutitermitis]GGD56360.1 hypothetical protein GCM10010911_12600 [Paenibacillus nasutitermitis]